MFGRRKEGGRPQAPAVEPYCTRARKPSTPKAISSAIRKISAGRPGPGIGIVGGVAVGTALKFANSVRSVFVMHCSEFVGVLTRLAAFAATEAFVGPSATKFMMILVWPGFSVNV